MTKVKPIVQIMRETKGRFYTEEEHVILNIRHLVDVYQSQHTLINTRGLYVDRAHYLRYDIRYTLNEGSISRAKKYINTRRELSRFFKWLHKCNPELVFSDILEHLQLGKELKVEAK